MLTRVAHAPVGVIVDRDPNPNPTTSTTRVVVVVVVVAAVALDTCDVGGRADAAHQGARRDRVLTRPLEGLGVGVG